MRLQHFLGTCRRCRLIWERRLCSTMGKSLYPRHLSVLNWQKKNSVYYFNVVFKLTTTPPHFFSTPQNWLIKTWNYILLLLTYIKYERTHNIRKPRKSLTSTILLLAYNTQFQTKNINSSSLVRQQPFFCKGSFRIRLKCCWIRHKQLDLTQILFPDTKKGKIFINLLSYNICETEMQKCCNENWHLKCYNVKLTFEIYKF